MMNLAAACVVETRNGKQTGDHGAEEPTEQKYKNTIEKRKKRKKKVRLTWVEVDQSIMGGIMDTTSIHSTACKTHGGVMRCDSRLR